MRSVFAVFAALCMLAPPAGAKGRMTMSLGDSSPRVGQHITVVLRMTDVVSNRKPEVMVVAVAPGRGGAPGFTAPPPILRTVGVG